MRACVNKSSKEFKELLNTVFPRQHPIVLAAKINEWQELNNTDLFPTKEQIELGKSIIKESKTIKDGVNFVFEQNPELASIGSKEQYSTYLSSNNYVNIYYHATSSSNKFDKFDKNKIGSTNLRNTSGTETISLVDNLKSAQAFSYFGLDSFYAMTKEDLYATDNSYLATQNKYIIPVVIKPWTKGTINNLNHGKEINIEDLDALLILGSQDDINGFKQYVNKSPKELDGQLRMYSVSDSEVKYSLKSVDILLSDKAKQVFDKGNKNNWSLEKILTELAVPKEQKQLLLDLGLKDREQLALELASKYGYSVEVNTAKTTEYNNEHSDEVEDIMSPNSPTGSHIENTSFYSNLTVPGGTNGSYREENFITPNIVPSIQGHAQFSTEHGIGWFRSDEQRFNSLELSRLHNEGKFKSFEEEEEFVKQNTKTRRILEIQSDWGQKQRKQSDPDMMINFNETKFLQDLQYAGDLKIECD
jgi:hypothetical protein